MRSVLYNTAIHSQGNQETMINRDQSLLHGVGKLTTAQPSLQGMSETYPQLLPTRVSNITPPLFIKFKDISTNFPAERSRDIQVV